MEAANVRVTRETLIKFPWNAGWLGAGDGEWTLPGCFLSWVPTAFIISFKVQTKYRSLVNLCMSTSYTLFNTLTVSLTYWVILKTRQSLLSGWHFCFLLPVLLWKKEGKKIIIQNWSQMKIFITGKGLKEPTQASSWLFGTRGLVPISNVDCIWMTGSEWALKLITFYETWSPEKQLCISSLTNAMGKISWADGSESAGLISLAEKGDNHQD